MSDPIVNPAMKTCPMCNTVHQYARCPKCEGDKNREIHDRLEIAIRALKARPGGEVERRLIHEIRDLGHPDVDGLLAAIGDQQ